MWRKREHFRIDPDNTQEAKQKAELRKAQIERKIARYKLRDEDGLDDGPKHVGVVDWLDGFCPTTSHAQKAVYIYISSSLNPEV